MAVTDIGLAVNDRRKNANGEWVDETTFVDVTLWGRTAEIGQRVPQQGLAGADRRPAEARYLGRKDGQKRSKLKVVGERMQMLGGAEAAEAEAAGGSQRPAAGGPGATPMHQPGGPDPRRPPPTDEFDGPPRGPAGRRHSVLTPLNVPWHLLAAPPEESEFRSSRNHAQGSKDDRNRPAQGPACHSKRLPAAATAASNCC